ncbi:MAG TPA: spermidine synthase [Chloroflexota bacterium]|nr:spermidine synthase [Chloroflexota bacterium]
MKGFALRRPEVQLFLTSALALYAELLCIRWIPAYVRFVAYFTNFILLASFLGLGVGILSARGRTWPWLNRRAFPWLLLAVVILVAITRFELRIESAGVLYYGASEEGAPPPENAFVLPAAFLLVSLLFVCLGRSIGDLLRQVTPPLRAYALDIGGSVTGVAGFFVLSLTEQPPLVWFVGVLLLMLLLTLPRWLETAVVAVPLLAVLFVAHTMSSGYWWSPYYRVGLTPVENHPEGYVLTVNNVGHQVMLPVEYKEPFYNVPYELFGEGAFKRALIIGAGSGSDAAVALHHGVQQIDAVEIDQMIARLGRAYHPDQPYADPRVTVHVDDGRSFLRKTGERFDLIVFALPDSLTLTSQFSSLRLESFLFTRESFEEARARLTDDGAIVLYNFYRETWLLWKLAAMLEAAFDQPPYVVSYGGWGRAAVLINGPRLARLNAESPGLLQDYHEEAVAPRRLADDPDAVQLPVIGTGLLRASAWSGDLAQQGDPPDQATDDWPLLYLRSPGIPGVYLIGLAMVGLCSLLLVLGLGTREVWRDFNGHMFFLGAAFMLLETRSLVSFALLFGSTWLVNSLVFFAILCSVLLAVFLSTRLTIKPSPALYALLLLALLAAYLIPGQALLSIDPPPLRYGVASVLAFLPIFLANLVFAGSFRLTGRQADLAFASNLLGVMVGGMLEYTALLYGYRHLLLLAIGFYVLSSLLIHQGWLLAPLRSMRRRVASEGPEPS